LYPQDVRQRQMLSMHFVEFARELRELRLQHIHLVLQQVVEPLEVFQLMDISLFKKKVSLLECPA